MKLDKIDSKLCRIKFNIVVGVLIRGEVKRDVMSQALKLGVDARVAEDKGFFESRYTFTGVGKDEALRAWYAAVFKIGKRYK